METIIGIENINPQDLPKSVYKFRSWNDGENNEVNRILTHQEIRLSSPRQLLADYPECILPHDFHSVTDEDLWQAALMHAQREFPNAPESDVIRIAHNKRRRMVFGDPQHREEVVKKYNKILYDCVGIFCTTLDCNDAKIWDHLGNLGKDYCVEFDPWLLFQIPEFGGGMGYVMYYNEYDPPKIFPITSPNVNPIQEIIKQLTSVPDRYSFEKEFRFWRINRDSAGNNYTSYSEEERKITLPKEVFRKVILGSEISKEDEQEIIEARNQFFPELPIFKTQYNADENSYFISSIKI